MAKVVAGLDHEHGEALAVEADVVDGGGEQGASVPVAGVHACAVVDQQRRHLAATVHGHVQLHGRQTCAVHCIMELAA